MNIKEFKSILRNSSEFKIKNKVDDFNYQDYLPERINKPFLKLNLIRGLASLVVVVFLGVFTVLSFTPVSNVFIEINPELTLELNRFNQVINVSGDNDEAITLIDSVNLKFRSIDKATELIYDYSIEAGYTINNNLYVLYAVESNQEDQITKINGLLDSTITANVKTLVVSSSYTTIDFRNVSPSYTPEISEGEYQDQDQQSGALIPESLGETDVETLIVQYQVSDLKLLLVMQIFNQRTEFTTIDDIEYLFGLDIEQLYNLYN